MKTIFNVNTLLTSTLAVGGLWVFLLFLFCFFGVHVARLTKFGWLSQYPLNHPEEKKPDPPKDPPAEKKDPAPAQEPVYYIVERKKKRSKSTYSEPKEIRFK